VKISVKFSTTTKTLFGFSFDLLDEEEGKIIRGNSKERFRERKVFEKSTSMCEFHEILCNQLLIR
jgi:hypothetical protein